MNDGFLNTDLEREYLIDDSIIEMDYIEEEEKLLRDIQSQTKIIIGDARKEDDRCDCKDSKDFKIPELKL